MISSTTETQLPKSVINSEKMKSFGPLEPILHKFDPLKKGDSITLSEDFLTATCTGKKGEDFTVMTKTPMT